MLSEWVPVPQLGENGDQMWNLQASFCDIYNMYKKTEDLAD